MIPDIPGLRESGYITSTEALRRKHLPKTLTIIGGGYIAAKMAHFFGSLGSRISIVQRSDKLLSREDEEISRAFTDEFGKRYSLLSAHVPLNVRRKGELYQTTVKSLIDSTEKIIESEELLVATVIKPNTDILKPEITGVKLNQNGFVQVNEFLESNIKGIYAIGDVIGRHMLKHSANMEAQYSYYNIIDPKNRVPVSYDTIPRAVFSSPQIAGVGLTERDARLGGYDISVGRYNYIDTGMGKAIKESTGLVKIIVDRKSRRILGCHIMGADASTLLHEVVVAMNSGDGIIDNITSSVHVHPALSEVILRAGLSARSGM